MRATSTDTRDLVFRLLDAQERERRRVARALHDDPIQCVVAIALRLELLAREADPDPAMRDALASLGHEALEALERMRDLVSELQQPDEISRGVIDRISGFQDVAVSV
jgi:signal transduction histidine kinase